MLSVSAMSGGQGNYYSSLAQEDYYLEGGEPEGVWFGNGATALGLEGTVQTHEFRNVFDGYSPDGERALVQNTGKESRKPGWDLTFSAPKSLSVVWSQSAPQTRQVIQKIFFNSVKKALSYLEENTVTRRGHDGLVREGVGLVIAIFEHGTSRLQDPQIHAHCLAMNLGVREDGTTGAITSKQFYTHKMAAGALFRAELAYQLQDQLELALVRKNTWFEIAEVPEPVIEAFSKRRQEIEKRLLEKGFESAKAAEVAALDTRSVKAHKARSELFREWQGQGEALGFGMAAVSALFGKVQRTVDVLGEIQETIHTVSQAITYSNSTFFERDAIRLVAEESQGRGIGADLVKSMVHAYLKSEDVVSLGLVRDETRFTTQDMLQIESRMMSQVVAMSDRTTHIVDSSTVPAVLRSKCFASIREEQRSALLHITQRPGAVQVVRGMAGTGKTYLLAAAKVVWALDGYDVQGICLSGKAVTGLEEAQIPSSTIAKFLGEGGQGLTSKTVLICDEAGMVGTRQMAQIIDAVNQTGAKLILVGDERQLQAIEAGGAFKAIANRVGQAELQEITRQQEAWAREAVHHFAKGDAQRGLQAYLEKGLLTISRHRTQAIQTIISDWSKGGGRLKPKEHLILAGARRDVLALNLKVQKERLVGKSREGAKVKIRGGFCYPGDRIVFTKNSTVFRVKNGVFATVLKIKDNELTVELDNQQKRVVKLRNQADSWQKGYLRDDISLGYATTTHKAQGATAAHVYVLTDETMQNRELSYVQMSRSKLITRLYTTQQESSEDLTDLVQRMNRTGQKVMAMEIHQ